MNLVLAEKISQWLLTQEDCDCNDRRFYCSYLISHSSICLGDSTHDKHYFSSMSQSLVSAFAADKLSEPDRLGINALWAEARSNF